jgi:NADPH:quinone reductase-like Zn-dependent oxidoreductase
VRQKLGGFITSEKSGDLRFLRDLIESAKITPAIDRAYPLIETPAAIRHVQEGRARGAIVITIRSVRLESMIGVVRCVFW